IETFIKLLGKLSPLIPPLTAGITGLAVALTTLKVIDAVNGWISKMNNLTGQAKIAMNVYATATKQGATAAEALEIAQKTANGTMKLSTIIYGTVTGKIKIMEVAQLALAKATLFLQSTTGFLVVALGAIAAVSAT
ncbi:hypothetical protein, partial [Enterobacter quasiroggenkampii]|uniref:hypothetical protein n=1 Tax=Enterobacter quasiroggenkampii TaxID=2497436 RepID=UPI0021D2D3A4